MKKAFLGVGACLSIFGLTDAQAKTRQPNIIVINCDDMGYGDLSCFGNPVIKTPNLDKMADEGQKWSSFYVGSPVSSPSRACLMTGRLGVRTGMYGDRLEVLFPVSLGGLPQEELTMAELLKSAGYNTAIVGKWHMGHLEQFLPLQHGFDYFWGFPFSNDMSKREKVALGEPNYPHEYIVYENEKIIDREPLQYTLTQRVTKAAVNYIERQKKNPFFLYMAHPMPHIPIYASEDFQGTSDGGKYGDTIEEIDWSVGEIMKVLKKKHFDKNTLVIFTSDNGPWLMYKQNGGSSGPLNRGKNSHYEGGFRVPCIMWGSMVDHGHITQMGSTLDLLPTFCEMAGVNLPEDRVYDGQSILNVLEDHTAKSPREEFFFYRGSRLYAVRKGNFKLHFLDKPEYGPGKMVKLEKPVLYEISSDPGEHWNIADKYPKKVKELTELAEQHKASFVPAAPIFDNIKKKK